MQASFGRIYIKKWTPVHLLSATPLILFHDSLGSIELWKGFPERLANIISRPVIAYDRLGFGKSDTRQDIPSDQFIEEEATRYFPEIKSHLGVQNYMLLGHSVGGGMVINIAAHDSQCKGVITIAAQAFVEEITLQGIELAKKHFQQAQEMAKLAKWHGEKAQWVLNAWVDTWLRPSFRQWRLNNIEQVNAPVLAIHGEKDEYGSKAFPEFIVNNVSDFSKIALIDDCGHMPHKSHTEQVLNEISTFIGNI